MNDKWPDLCSLCAWRETCQKRFSRRASDGYCPEFAEDLLLKKRLREDEAHKEKDTGEGSEGDS